MPAMSMGNSVLMVWALGFRNPRMIKQAKSLAAKGHRVELAYWHRDLGDEEDFEKKYDLSPFRVHRLTTSKAGMARGTANILRRVQFVFKTARLAMQSRTEIVHAIDFDAALGALIGLTVVRRKVHLIYDIADFLEDYQSNYPFILKWVVKKLSNVICRRADYVIIPDEERRKHLPLDVQDSAVVVNNAPDLRDLGLSINNQRDYSENNKKMVVYYYGTMSEDRGLGELMTAVHDLGEGFELLIAGWGTLETRVKEMAAKCDRISFIGSLDQRSALEHLKAIDIVYAVYDPSVKINQMASPTKFFEAMAFERPVMVCRGTTVDRLVEKYGVGVLVDYSAESIKASLRTFMLNGGVASYLEKIRSIKNLYVWESSDMNMHNIYRKIVNTQTMGGAVIP
jgi:glycosyltransferase involved in cell wall biosynthesis